MLKNISESLREASQVLSYDYLKDPIVKACQSSLEKIKEGVWDRARGFLGNIKISVENRIRQYASIEKFKDLKSNYDKALELIGKKDMNAVEYINAIIETHKNSKREIEDLQGMRSPM